MGPFRPPVPEERRSKGGRAKVRARSLFFSLALPSHQSQRNGAPQRRARKRPRAVSSFHWPPAGGTAKEGAQKSARNLSFHWPFLATSPGGTAPLKGGRAKVRAQPLLSIGPSWPPIPGERRSSKEGAQKSARNLSFHWLFLATSPRETARLKGGRKSPRAAGASQRRARKSPRAASSFHRRFLATSFEGTAFLKEERTKVRAQSLPSIGSFSPPIAEERRAQPLLSIGSSWLPVLEERRSSKESARFLGNVAGQRTPLPLALENALAAAAVFVDAPTTRRRGRKDVICHWRLKILCPQCLFQLKPAQPRWFHSN